MNIRICLLLLTVFPLVLSGQEKKVILSTFELRNARTEHLARNIKMLEKLPFDGIVISDQTSFDLKYPIGSNRKWSMADYARTIADMKTISSGRLKNNFMLTLWSPRNKRISMTDEAAWERCAYNAGIIARAAKEGGCVGFIFDSEDYSKTKQFIYHPGEDGATFEEAAKQMRNYGAKIMRAMGKEFPEVKILSYYLFCSLAEDTLGDHVEPGLKMKNKLWSYFVNGLFDGLPEHAKIIEGNELSYYFQSDRQDFIYTAFDSVRRNMRFVAPENHKKFKSNGEFAFAMYIDAYSNPSGIFYKEPLDGSKLKRFRQDLSEALRLTDEYVWLYGEKSSWIKEWDERAVKAIFSHPSGIPSKVTCQELHPGIVEAISLAKNPLQVGKSTVQTAKKSLNNLVPNPTCNPNISVSNKITPPYLIEWGYLKEKSLVVPGWYFWPHWDFKPEKSSLNTKIGVDDQYSLCGKNLPYGAFVTDIKVQPGNYYYVEAMMRGTGSAVIQIRWRSKMETTREPFTGKKIMIRDWLHSHGNSYDSQIFFPDGGSDQWRHADGAVRAPDGAEVMTVLLYMIQGANSEKYNYFDNIGVYEIQPLSPDQPINNKI